MSKATLLVAVFVLIVAGSVAARGSSQPEEPAQESAVPETPTEVETNETEPGGSVTLDTQLADALYQAGVIPFTERVPSNDFLLLDLDGMERSLSEFLGKWVFLNFWATWCPPCREEMPAMQILYDEFAESGLEILAVNVLESSDLASAFISEQGFTYPVVLDTDGRVMLNYSVRAYPTTYIIDRDGYVVGIRPGYHTWAAEEVMEAFGRILAME